MGGYEVSKDVSPQTVPIILVEDNDETSQSIYVKYPSGKVETLIAKDLYINRIIQYFPRTNEVFFEGKNNNMMLLSLDKKEIINLGRIYSIIPLESYDDERYIYITESGVGYNNGSKRSTITNKKLSSTAPRQAKEVSLNNVVYLEEGNALKLHNDKGREILISEKVTDFNVIGKERKIVFTNNENELCYYDDKQDETYIVDKFATNEDADAALSVGMDCNNGKIVYSKIIDKSTKELYLYNLNNKSKEKVIDYSGNGEAFLYEKWIYLYNGAGIEAINIENKGRIEIVKSSTLKLYKLKDRGLAFSYGNGSIYEMKGGSAKVIVDNIEDILVYKDKIMYKTNTGDLFLNEVKIDSNVGVFTMYNNLAVYVNEKEVYVYDTVEQVKHKYSNLKDEYEVYFLKEKIK